VAYNKDKESLKMDENLLASILRTNEKIQECLNYSVDVELYPHEGNGISNEKKTENNQDQETKSPQYEDLSCMEERYIVSIIGTKQMRNDSSLTKQLFIMYEISVTRIVDGVTRSVFRRFRDIREFYHDGSKCFSLLSLVYCFKKISCFKKMKIF
jgi:hypothetical protein